MTKILVIDDDFMVRAVIVQILEDAGHTVVIAENGRHGFALFGSEQPDLVITDIIMPEEEGIQTLINIRRARPDAKVIVISGGGRLGTGSDFLAMARALGAADVLAKPFDTDDFLRRVAGCLAA